MTLAEALRAMMLSLKLRKDWNAYADRLVAEEQASYMGVMWADDVRALYIDPYYVKTGARR